MKKVIPIILFTVSAILLSACGRKEELYEIPDLSQYKTDYVGDSSNVINIVKLDKLHLQLIENGTKVKGLVEKVYLQKYTRYRRQIPYRILYSFTYHDKVYYHKSRLIWEKPDLKKGDLITVYVNNLGKSTVYNCNEAV